MQELQWIFEAKIYLGEVTKSINYQTNNKSPGNDDLTAVLEVLPKWTICYPFRYLKLLGKALHHGCYF